MNYFSTNFFRTLAFNIALLLLASYGSVTAQLSRIKFHNQNIFLSGSNVAWVNFAADIGAGGINAAKFNEIFAELHANGGNSMRLWLHTDGTVSPEFNDSGFVISPGSGAVSDLKQILDLAKQNDVALLLCLWSHDMLRTTLSQTILNRNKKLLTDTSAIRAYINNALIPLVEGVKGHPAILAWEIFNEPEGFTEVGNWSNRIHVTEYDVQRFVNLTAGAIHRTDSTALVTNGTWNLQALTDITIPAKISSQALLNSLSNEQKRNIENEFKTKFGLNLSAQEIIERFSNTAANKNYYRDDRLIAAGGDSSGTLDFYTCHYYTGFGTAISPFHHSYSYWELDKPLAIAEFFMEDTYSIPYQNLFELLFSTGYAGALSWQWWGDTQANDNAKNGDHSRTIAAMQDLWNKYKPDIEINISGSTIAITSPSNNSFFPDSSNVNLVAEVNNIVYPIIKVEFFANDTLKIGERDSLPYSINWTNIPSNTYFLTAVATDSLGYKITSNIVKITVGTPTITKLEAENASIHGLGITTQKDPTASNGSFYNIATNDTNVTVTWQFTNSSDSGDYPITFGYKLFYDTPKTQFLNINGVRSDTITFEGSKTLWLQKTIVANLRKGINTVQMQMWWGWMYLDYMGVPSSIITSVPDNINMPQAFALYQNYPNPFNPATKIEFTLTKTSEVNVTVFDLLGQKVAELVNNQLNAGNHSVIFNASNLSSGIYFYSLQAEDKLITKKMILLK